MGTWGQGEIRIEGTRGHGDMGRDNEAEAEAEAEAEGMPGMHDPRTFIR